MIIILGFGIGSNLEPEYLFMVIIKIKNDLEDSSPGGFACWVYVTLGLCLAKQIILL